MGVAEQGQHIAGKERRGWMKYLHSDPKKAAYIFFENLRLVKFALDKARRMNKGHCCHAINKVMGQLEDKEFTIESQPMLTTKDEFMRMCSLRQQLCDLMWQAEHYSTEYHNDANSIKKSGAR